MTAKPKRTFDDALIEYVATLSALIHDYGNTSATTLNTDDADAELRAADADHAADAETAIEVAATVVRKLQARVEAAVARMGDRSFVARAVASDLIGVFIAVAGNRTDPALLIDVQTAEAEVTRHEELHARTLLALETAVTSADIDAVMRLRPEVEVTLPSLLDAARLALFDARLAVQQATLDAAQQLTTSAANAQANTQRRLEEAHAAVTAAADAHNSVSMVNQQTDAAAQHVRSIMRDLDTERAALAGQLEQDKQRRFRRLAGLPEPVDVQPEDFVDRNPFGHTVHQSQFAS